MRNFADILRTIIFAMLVIGFATDLPGDLRAKSYWWFVYDIAVCVACGSYVFQRVKARIPAVLLLALFFCHDAHAQQTSTLAWDDPRLALHVPQEILQQFRNPDGSCVQCSNGMTGTDQGVPEFAYLLWDSEYGPKVRGGSNPSRVANYAKARNVRIYNVTGSKTWDWMRSACLSGRGAAIGAGGAHFQTLVGYLPERKTWVVVNNNGDQRRQEYSDEAFRQLHLASGQWCVILDYPPAPAPAKVREWWK